MNNTCQSYYTLKNPGDNIDKTHELYTLYYLFEIFKELNPTGMKDMGGVMKYVSSKLTNADMTKVSGMVKGRLNNIQSSFFMTNSYNLVMKNLHIREILKDYFCY